MSEPTPYKEAFPVGTKVCIAKRAALDEFMATWKYHHKLRVEQLSFANRETNVKTVGYYHGGDPVYTLEGIPGIWLEQCLRPAQPSRDGSDVI
jgi:hypothetical protein